MRDLLTLFLIIVCWSAQHAHAADPDSLIAQLPQVEGEDKVSLLSDIVHQLQRNDLESALNYCQQLDAYSNEVNSLMGQILTQGIMATSTENKEK